MATNSTEWNSEVIEIAAGLTMKILAKTNNLSVDYIMIDPDSVESSIVHRATDEFIYVLHGALDARVGGREFSLEKGQSCFIEKGTPHMFSNNSGQRVEILSVCNPAYDSNDVYQESSDD